MTTPSSPAPAPTLIRSVSGASLFIIVSLIQLFLAGIVIPRFTAIFHDMLGDQPLPMLTALVIQARWPIAAFACACALAAVLVIRRKQSFHWLVALLILLFLQIGVTVIALFMPLSGIIERLSGH